MRRIFISRSRSQEGQSLVIIAVVFVVLVIFAGLAIDGGNTFVQRRQAQNASDAAAMAGTRLIAAVIQSCDAFDSAALAAIDAEIHRTINQYAEQNGISDTDGIAGNEVNDNVVAYYVDSSAAVISLVGTGDLPTGTSGVRVAVQDTHDTFFLPIARIKEFGSAAPATALTGKLKQPAVGGKPIIPIAVPYISVKEFEDAEAGTEFLMHDSGEHVGEFCHLEGGECVVDPDPEYPNEAQRGWLNLNHIFNAEYPDSEDWLNRTFESELSNAGCPKDYPDPNEPELPSGWPDDKSDLPGIPGYATGECPYLLSIFAGGLGDHEGDFIHGSSGSRGSDVKAVYEALETFDSVFAPVFDRAYTVDEMVNGDGAGWAGFGEGAASPDGFPNGGGFSSAGGGAGEAYYYHIVGWVSVSGLYDEHDKLIVDKSNKIVYGAFQQYEVSPGDITAVEFDGSGTCSIMQFGIQLWE
jgi:Flp pilus assembly protein TadG